MPNERNLIPFTSNQSREEAKKNGAKGGKASGEAKRAKKKLKEYANTLLALPVTNTEMFNNMTALGIEIDDIDNKMLMVTALWIKACQGDVAAAKEIRSIIGEDNDPKDTDELNKLDEMIRITKELANNGK